MSTSSRFLTSSGFLRSSDWSSPFRCAVRPCQRRWDTNVAKTDESVNPRVAGFGRAIEDDYASIRENYATPRNPIVLAHGLLGFDEFHIAGSYFPGIQYWRGITDALRANGIEVITASVPASGSIEARAAKLQKNIEDRAHGKSVNIVAGKPVRCKEIAGKAELLICCRGLDSRFMISQLQQSNFAILSLTTIATPHRGSAFADFVFQQIGPQHLPRLYKVLESLGMETGAFQQLTRAYMTEDFNKRVQDKEGVKYYSYGATFEPSLWSTFRQSHRIVAKEEGSNDGLVSVQSSQWGDYKGTLIDVSHLDLINWTNRLRWLISELTGNRRKFNAVAFYLSIGDMLAKEGF